VRMGAQVARPGLQHPNHPNLSTGRPLGTARIGSELLECRGRAAEEHAVHLARVLACEGSELGGQGKGHQEVGHPQEQGVLLGQPGLSLFMLAGGTVAIATGVIGVAHRGTAGTGVDVPAQCLRPALLNRGHCCALAGRESCADVLTVGGAIPPKDLAKGDHRICSSKSLMTALARWLEAMVRWV
jgi:hypothetical protein